MCGRTLVQLENILLFCVLVDMTRLVAWWSELLTTNHEVPGSIPLYHVRFSLKGEDAHGDHGLGSW